MGIVYFVEGGALVVPGRHPVAVGAVLRHNDEAATWRAFPPCGSVSFDANS